MYFGDDEEDSGSSSDSNDSSSGSSNDGGSSDVVDLSDKQGVVDPSDLKKDDPPEQSLPIQEPPSPYIPTPGISGDDPRIDISGRTPDSTDISAPDPSQGSDSGGDSGGGDGDSSSSSDDNN